MIPRGVEIFVGLEPIDLRWGFDRLAGVVAERIGREARGGALFVFFGKRRTAIKVMFWDGSGMCLFYERLDKGVFRILARTRRRARLGLFRSVRGGDLRTPGAGEHCAPPHRA